MSGGAKFIIEPNTGKTLQLHDDETKGGELRMESAEAQRELMKLVRYLEKHGFSWGHGSPVDIAIAMLEDAYPIAKPSEPAP
jgi:hypothetical protein